MNRSVRRILICFIISAVLIALLLLVINFFAFAYLAGDWTQAYPMTVRQTLNQLSEHLTSSEDGFSLIDSTPDLAAEGAWAILIAPDGTVVWQENKPPEVPEHYSINDVARMSRWYLKDYPVYVRTREEGLLVLGLPKLSQNKYQLELSGEWFRTLPQRIFGFLGLNLLLAILLAAVVGILLGRALKPFADGVQNLKLQRPVRLRTKGLFRELSKSVNETSEVLERKNQALKKRDEARANWIAGISHDIRTPLAMIMGYAGELATDPALDEEEKRKAEIVTRQSLRIKKLIEDLNLISSLEYEMQPASRNPIRVCALVRKVVSDFLNNGLGEQFVLEMELSGEAARIEGDEKLLERAVYNLIGNSIQHNPEGCRITVKEWIDQKNSRCGIEISDTGRGADPAALERLHEIPKSAHGLGLPMAYKIIGVHGGEMTAENRDGFRVTIYLPLL